MSGECDTCGEHAADCVCCDEYEYELVWQGFIANKLIRPAGKGWRPTHMSSCLVDPPMVAILWERRKP